MESRQSPVMLGKRAKRSYDELVRYYKFINNTTRVESYLAKLFNRELEKLKENFEGSVCRNSKHDLTQNQLECIERLEKRWNVNNWDDYGKRQGTRIPLDQFKEEIKQSFGVTGRDAINNHKKTILQILNLRQTRIKDKWIIVHKQFELDK